jgi:hypothetical protein
MVQGSSNVKPSAIFNAVSLQQHSPKRNPEKARGTTALHAPFSPQKSRNFPHGGLLKQGA